VQSDWGLQRGVVLRLCVGMDDSSQLCHSAAVVSIYVQACSQFVVCRPAEISVQAENTEISNSVRKCKITFEPALSRDMLLAFQGVCLLLKVTFVLVEAHVNISRLEAGTGGSECERCDSRCKC
jgi:hypothetical protein